ncbi:MAG TPA: ABC transporter permease [Candidatus Baltobacteraceae bacterium]|jgi:peptide/nickel transport system permease protein|nr:ABC transporter permease [Candidatus Baltobacteraceae bacterium]
MTNFILRRLVLAVPTLIGVTIITFVLLHLAPGGPALALAGEKATPAQIATVTHELGLDKPWPEQYVTWLGALLHGDLGFSYIRQQPVIALIGQRLPQTMLLMGCALLVSVLLAVPLGVYQAYRRNTAFDRTASVFVFMAWSMPTFWFGTILIAVFAVTLRWFPVGGLQTIDTTAFDLPSRIAHLVLPAATLAIVSMAGWSRYIRGSMVEQLREDYARTAIAKGLPQQRVLFRHTLRNALIPFITLLGGTVPALFGGAVITEQIFAYPGMGQLFWQSATDRDYSTLLGMTVITAVLVVLGNLLADVLYGVVDPRVRYD